MAVLLADAIRRFDAGAQFEGIGAERMRAAGFSIWRDHTGWASMGPLAAIPRIPKLLAIMVLTAAHIVRTKPDIVVLVDYGVFNLRLARQLRRLRYAGPILDLFPPGTWLDDARKACLVSGATIPLTAFEHQYDFYRSVGCRIVYFGHPLASRYTMRDVVAPPNDGGTVALLPGSRSGELKRHLPVLAAAYRTLQLVRPKLRGVAGAAGDRARATIAHTLAAEGLEGIEIVDGVLPALAHADAAWVASGTAVLETALSGVPAVALYVIPRVLIPYGRKMVRHRFITLPNLVLDREVVPELLQDNATPEKLAAAIDGLMRDSSQQRAEYLELRRSLGAPDALDQCARYAVELAGGAA